ncbi:MAG TPA: amidase [Nevskiales bacterium]|nr:amidase [Nevskiales bacterium]
MNFDEYRKHDGLGLAELVAKKEVTPAELLEVAIARAEAVNPKLNAIIIPMYDLARERARQALSGPFAGVPFLVKDLFQEYAGVRAAYGCKALKAANYTADAHAEITARWLKAGTVIFGRTNTPEFGAKGITEPDAWGPTRNAWNPAHTPGGSSGGSATAVAAGIVPMAGANDGGGSIRIPASACGLFGLKPGRGRTPWGPRYGELMHGAAMNHIVSRSVRDSAAMLDATHGPELGSLFRIEPPERPYIEEVTRDPGKLRIAFTTRSPIGMPVHPEAVRAVRETAQLLASLGHHVEGAEPEINGLQLAEDFITMWFANCAATVDEIKKQTGCGDSGFELDTLAMVAFGHASRASEYVAGYLRWSDYARKLGEFHQKYDLLMTPTWAMPPARIGEIVTPRWQQVAMKILMALGLTRVVLNSGMIEKMVQENLKWVPFTQLANLTGVPAMSVPLHWTTGEIPAPQPGDALHPERKASQQPPAVPGLPMGVQFVAPHGGEGLLFRLAGQLEQAKPWFHRVPEL